MIDSLVMDPFQGRSVRKLVGYTHARELATQTQVIPDEILGLLVRARSNMWIGLRITCWIPATQSKILGLEGGALTTGQTVM